MIKAVETVTENWDYNLISDRDMPHVQPQWDYP
jgi:hypothetical protein